MLKHLSDEQLQKLTVLLQQTWNHQTMPTCWKYIKAIPLLKPGRDNDQIGNYRIISLQNVMYKLFNKILKQRIAGFIETRRLIPDNSFGFRPGVGINEFGVTLVKNIELNNSCKYVTVLISLDLEKAFDKVATEKLISVMKSQDFPNKYIYWIYRAFTGRQVTLEYNSFAASKILDNGLPQGDILSPMLFNIYSSVLHQLENDDTKIMQYADDFSILIRDKNVYNLNNKVQEFLNRFIVVAESLNLSINPSKTSYICINLKDTIPVSIRLNNAVLKEENTVKILGVTYDRKLKFHAHFRETKTRCLRMINVLKMLNNKRGGAHPSTMLNAYKSLVVSRFLFGSVITHTQNKQCMQLLQVISNNALRLVLGLTKTTPIHAILAEACTWPCKSMFQFESAKFILKHIYKNTTIGQHIRNLQCCKSINLCYNQFDIFKNIPVSPTICLKPSNLNVICHLCNYDKNAHAAANRAAAIEVINTNIDKSAAYTDASLNNDKVGIGIYLQKTQEQICFKINQSVSIKTAEIVAIMSAIKLLLRMEERNFIIYTDSLSSCIALRNTIHKSSDKYYENVIMQIANQHQECSITIQWVPAHIGIAGNETADLLAKSAIENTSNAIAINIKIPVGDARRLIKKTINDEWTASYKESAQHKGKHYAEIVKSPPLKNWFCQSKLKAGAIRQINRLRAGHSFDKKYMKTIRLIPSDYCETCQTTENATHIISNCAKFNIIRRKYHKINNNELTGILRRATDTDLQDVINFLKEIDIRL